MRKDETGTGQPTSQELDARLDAFLPGFIRGMAEHGKIGHGPGQVPPETVQALGRRMQLEDLRSQHRAVFELGHALTVAATVLAPHVDCKGAMRDPFVAEVLLHVARLTAAGQLEEGARVIDRALGEVQRGTSPPPGMLGRLSQAFAGRPTRHSELLLAQMRQRILLHDAEGVADSLLARAALFHQGQPAWSQGFGEQIIMMAKEGQQADINFLLHVAAAMAWHRLESARTPEQRRIAWVTLTGPLITLADREPGAATLDTVLHALRQAIQTCKETGNTQDLPILEAALNEFGKRQPQRREQAPNAAQPPATRDESRIQGMTDRPHHQPQPRATPAASATEPHKASQDRIRELVADMQAQGYVGTAPNQVPPACAMALVRSLAPDDLADPRRSACELSFALTAAVDLLKRCNDAPPDLNLGTTLRRVARLAADGQFQQATAVVDAALAETEAARAELGEQVRHDRRMALLAASVRLADLLRDSQRTAESLIALVTLAGVDQPALSEPVAGHIQALQKQHLDHGFSHPLDAANTLAKIRCEAARTPDERGRAMSMLGCAQATSGNHNRSKSQLDEALHTLHQACKILGAEGLLAHWAETRFNECHALVSLGQLERSPVRLANAVASFRDVIHVLYRANDRTPARSGAARQHLGRMLLTLEKNEGGFAHLDEAIQACRDAHQVFTHADAPQQFAETHACLQKAERLLRERSDAAPPGSRPTPAVMPAPSAAPAPSLAELARQAQALVVDTAPPPRRTASAPVWWVGGAALIAIGLVVAARQPTNAGKTPPATRTAVPSSSRADGTAALQPQPVPPNGLKPPPAEGQARAATAALAPEATAVQPPVAQPYNDPLISRAPFPDERKPSIGGDNRFLDEPQVRWCMREAARLNYVRTLVNTGSKAEMARFNLWAGDHGLRCSSFEYINGDMKRIKRDLETERESLLADAKEGWNRQPEGRLPNVPLFDRDCKRGFRMVPFKCVAVEIPPYGQLDKSGHDWECKRSYRPTGDECVKPTPSASAPTEATTAAERERQAQQADAKRKDEIAARLEALHRDWRGIEASPGYFYFRAKNPAAGERAWIDAPSAEDAAQGLLRYAQSVVPGTTAVSLPTMSADQLMRGGLRMSGLVTHINRRLGFFIVTFAGFPAREVVVRDGPTGKWYLLAAGKVEGATASFTIPEQMSASAIDQSTQIFRE